MSRFDTIIVVDWSAAATAPKTGRADAIWAGVVRDGQAEAAVYLGDRIDAETWLAETFAAERTAGRRVLAGFDFPFGYPAGFAQSLTGADDPFAVWEWLEARIEDGRTANNRFAVAAEINAMFPGTGPFWGNPTKADLPDLPRLGTVREGHGFAERRAIEDRHRSAFPVWQLSGAGAVGSQVLMGLPVLSRLRHRFGEELSVWPFGQTETPIVLAEVWPSLLSGAVIDALDRAGGIKDARQVEILSRALASVSDDTLAEMLAEGDAEEGWILGSGYEEALVAALDTPLPPPLRDDCFALPAGVDWAPVDTALDRLRAALRAVTPVETLPIAGAGGHYLAETQVAQRAHPPVANSAVDGYGFAFSAIGSGDHQVLPLVEGRAAAGQPFAGTVPAGRAIRILTGAAVPDGVDTVVLQEDVTVSGGKIAFRTGLRAGANTRKAGEDVEPGDTLLERGRCLTPADLAHLSSAGISTVPVHALLRVGVLSTGAELGDPADDLRPDQTIDANRPMLLEILRRWGFDARDLGRVGDERDALRATLDRAATEVDAILTSGGASTGDEDHLSAILASEGSVSTWRIAVKPGRPLALGLWRGVPVFGLPGNPVAAFVCTLVFARPALGVMAGGNWSVPRRMTVPAAFAKRKKPGRREYLRARLDDRGHVEVFASEGPGRISGLSWAEGLVELPDGAIDVEPGTPVTYLPFTAFGL